MQAIQNFLMGVPLIEQFFMNPVGLMALLVVIPLLIFYLMKPKPEEQIMPSMRFFQEEKKDDTLRRAYRKLITNLPLLLQLLAVTAFAGALANPYITAQESSEDTVLVLDRSASVSDGFNYLKQELEDYTGEKNTLIVADSEAKVLAEEASESRIKTILQRMEPVHTETDLVSALQIAQNYRGELVVASDLDQTADQRNPLQNLDNQADRPIEVIDPRNTNNWGITSVEPGKNRTEVEISNFQTENTSLEVETPEGTRQLLLAPETSAVIRVNTQKGRNTVKLPDDGLDADNTAYMYLPDQETIKVSYEGPVNRYFDKAIDLASGIQLNYTETVQEPDVYFLASDVSSGKQEVVRQSVEQGSAAVVTPGSNALSQVFGYNSTENIRNTSLRINQPVRASIGEVKVLDRGINAGKSFTTPGYGVRKIEYGEGTVLAYNIMESGFETNFIYPVFWRDIIQDIVDRPSVSQLNRETDYTVQAETVQGPDGERYTGTVEMNKTGFYTTETRTYAVNLESPRESDIEKKGYTQRTDSGSVQFSKSLQNLAVVIILLLIGMDMIYLWYRGDL